MIVNSLLKVHYVRFDHLSNVLLKTNSGLFITGLMLLTVAAVSELAQVLVFTLLAQETGRARLAG